MSGEKNVKRSSVSTTFKVGAIALAFLVIGYQVALFVQKAALAKITANRDRPDTVFVVDPALAASLVADAESGRTFEKAARGGGGHTAGGARNGGAGDTSFFFRKNSPHSEEAERVRAATRKVESFPFDPNTVSVQDLQRLGFSEKQALSIDKYRQSGGRFRRKADFAKSFVVSDSIYNRLKEFIQIPKIDINRADSAAFDSLPGIGGYFASKMVSYREQLGGYSYPEQLMDIYHFDQEKFDGLKDLIRCSSPRNAFELWSLPAEELKKHPYIKNWQTAKSIVFYREHNDTSKWTVDGLLEAGVLTEECAAKLRRCSVATPR